MKNYQESALLAVLVVSPSCALVLCEETRVAVLGGTGVEQLVP